jgi:hypothetical protein
MIELVVKLPKEAITSKKMGFESVDRFEFIVGQTWLSSYWTPVITVTAYLGALWLLKAHVSSRKQPYDLRKV